MTAASNKCARFRALHDKGCFIIPNPWNTGSARYLESLGFKALATTSSGHAWSHGHHDGGMRVDAVLDYMREIVDATELPVNADFENGFAKDAQGVAENVRRAVQTGVAGLSIEDSTGDLGNPIFDIDTAIERMKAARAAIDESGGKVLLVGRSENFIWGRPDLKDTVRRLEAYAEAGADCLYAPGIKTREEIEAVVAAVKPRPVNLLVGANTPLTLDEIAAMGVRRISTGGALARVAWGGFMQAAQSLSRGRLDIYGQAASGKTLNDFFGKFDT